MHKLWDNERECPTEWHFNHTEKGASFRIKTSDGKLTEVEVQAGSLYIPLNLVDSTSEHYLPEHARLSWESKIADIEKSGGLHEPVVAPVDEASVLPSETEAKGVAATILSKLFGG